MTDWMTTFRSLTAWDDSVNKLDIHIHVALILLGVRRFNSFILFSEYRRRTKRARARPSNRHPPPPWRFSKCQSCKRFFFFFFGGGGGGELVKIPCPIRHTHIHTHTHTHAHTRTHTHPHIHNVGYPFLCFVLCSPQGQFCTPLVWRNKGYLLIVLRTSQVQVFLRTQTHDKHIYKLAIATWWKYPFVLSIVTVLPQCPI